MKFINESNRTFLKKIFRSDQRKNVIVNSLTFCENFEIYEGIITALRWNLRDQRNEKKAKEVPYDEKENVEIYGFDAC